MTYDEVKNIMEKNSIYPGDYRINGEGAPWADILFGLDRKDNKFRFWVKERNEIIRLKLFDNENDACVAFLRALSCDYPQLKRYIA